MKKLRYTSQASIVSRCDLWKFFISAQVCLLVDPADYSPPLLRTPQCKCVWASYPECKGEWASYPGCNCEWASHSECKWEWASYPECKCVWASYPECKFEWASYPARESPHYKPWVSSEFPAKNLWCRTRWTSLECQNAMRDRKSPHVGSPIPLVNVINSSTQSVPPPFCLATAYSLATVYS